jgi:hypothetical protein
MQSDIGHTSDIEGGGRPRPRAEALAPVLQLSSWVAAVLSRITWPRMRTAANQLRAPNLNRRQSLFSARGIDLAAAGRWGRAAPATRISHLPTPENAPVSQILTLASPLMRMGGCAAAYGLAPRHSGAGEKATPVLFQQRRALILLESREGFLPLPSSTLPRP